MKQKLLANIFVDGVVLQRDMPIKIWGKAAPHADINVKFDQDLYQLVAHADGKWEVILPALPIGLPHQLTVSSGNVSQEVRDILMGDIWICSGQSNMELPMSRTKRMFDDYNKTANNPHIRLYHVPMNFNFHDVQDDIPEATWLKVAPGETETFTATGFFFANKLYQETGVPIGLILSALGGTPVESWMSREALVDYPEILAQADECKQEGLIKRMMKSEQKANDAWYKNLHTFDRGLNERWYEEGFAATDWKEIDLNVPWDEVTDLRASGSIWFRKEIEIPIELVEKPVDIILGTIIDADEVYVNGKQVGGIGYRYPPRDYPVPHLKAGVNTIVIRVIAAHGIGGFDFGKEHKLLFGDGTEISLHADWKYKRALSCPPIGETTFFQKKPTGNYNGMIHPLHNFPIKGVIWYQGESNAGNPTGYSEKFSAMIKNWREKWQQGDFPFIFAQLSNWGPKGHLMHWELLRDEQTKTLAIPNTKMVVTSDVGEYNDLHPLNKKAVGERLAGEALSLAYGMDVVSTGPMLTTIEKSGNRFILHFETGQSKLTVKQNDLVYGLSVWVDEIEIVGEGIITDEAVIIETPYASKVTAISYAWIDEPSDANLYNLEGLPAVPFKRDLMA